MAALKELRIPSSVTEIDFAALHETGYYNNESNWSGNALYLDGWLLDVKESEQTALHIAEGTKHIANNVCSGHKRLLSVTFPEGLETVGSVAFSECRNIKKVVFPESLKKLGMHVFRACDSRIEVYFMGDAPEIGAGSFNASISELPWDTAISDDMTMFYVEGKAGWTWPQWNDYPTDTWLPGHEHQYTHSVTPPACIEWGYTTHTCSCGKSYIDTFEMAHGHAYVNGVCSRCGEKDPAAFPDLPIAPETIVKAGDCGRNLLWKLNAAGELIVFGQGMMNDYGNSVVPDWYGFEQQIRSVVVCEGVSSIGAYAFGHCSNLADVKLSNSIRKIGENAFYDCTALEEVCIPNTITKIAASTFYNCRSLRTVELPATLKQIGDGAFAVCNSLTSISLPDGVVYIGGGAFGGCSALTHFTIPNGVKTIGEETFINCDNLSSVDIPSGVTTIGYHAFSGCSSLTEITLPDGLLCIRGFAFEECKNLKSVTIPESVRSVGVDAFLNAGCYADASNWHDKVFYLSNWALDADDPAGDCTLLAGTIGIAASAFTSCNALTSVTAPESLRFIDNDAFYNCGSLKEITMPDGVEAIGYCAFSECTSLTSVVIPKSVKSLNNFTFRGCSNLKSVVFPNGFAGLGTRSFDECLSLQAVCFMGQPCYIGNEFRTRDNETGEWVNFPELTLYYIAGTPDWTSPSWNGYPTATWDGVTIPHKHNDQTTVIAPTCTEKGYTTHFCTICAESYTDTYVDALGHDFGAWEQTNTPTCTVEGEEKRTCSRCDAIETQKVAAKGHVEAIDNAAAATCTETGKTDGKHCSVCHAVLVAQTELPALGHKYENGACVRCGEKDPNAKPPVEYTDVPKTEWYAGAVQYAVQNGLMNGVGDGRFDPEGAMTRAMLVTVLWRYEGEPQEGTHTFSDVPNNQWYTDVVAWAAANRIVGGIGNGKFDPEGNITREQMATILYRYAEKKGPDTSKRGDLGGFPDGGKVQSWAKEAMQWVVAEGIINGSDGKLLPQGNATRAQVATILMRYIENIVKQ